MPDAEPAADVDLMDLMLSPRGRIARLPYVAACVTLSVLRWICGFMVHGLAGVVATVMTATSGDGSIALAFGMAAGIAVLIVSLYASTVLDVKRLRDIGISVRMAVLPLLISAASGLALTPSGIDHRPVMAALAVLVLQPLSACIFLALALWRGEPAPTDGT